MTRPEELSSNEPLLWSPGTGVEVWEMFQAALTGNLPALTRLLDNNPSLARCHFTYRTPLYFAVRENQVEAARLLLRRGSNPIGLWVNDGALEVARVRGYSEMEKLLETHIAGPLGASAKGEPLARAIRDRDLLKVREILDATPELLHAGDAGSNQPIHWAVMTRQIDMIDEMLARGADINAKRSDNARPVQLSNGDYSYRGWRDVPKETTATPAEILAFVISRGAYVDICTASQLGDLDRVRALLDGDPSLANYTSDYGSYYVGSGSPLRNAAARGHIEVVKLLLERGADPNLPEENMAPKGHALYSAVYNGHYEIAKLLLERGAFPNPPVESSADALTIAMRNAKEENGDQRMVELLCSYGAARSLDLLSYSGDVQTAAAVFAANPELADNPQALANAASNGHEFFVRLMLRYKPDLARRISLDAYWMIAAKTRELNELLFEHGMDPSRPDWLGVTPLHQFARKGEIEKAAQFLDHGADLNARDEDICSTPLGWAAKFGKLEMVEFLLKRGAKVSLPDDPPWATPLAWAIRRGHEPIAELLRSWPAA